jgi:PAS domain S-box-containing protein
VVPDPVSHELVLDGLPDPVLLVDCMGTVEWANPAAEDQLGHDVSRWRGHNVLEAVHPDDIDVALSAFASMADREAGTSGLLLALRVRHGNGHWIPIELRGRAIVTDGERRIVLVARNVSDRHRTAMDGGDPVLLRALVHHSSAVLILLDRDFCVRSASTEMTRLLHRDLRGTVGTRLTSFVAAHDRETIEDLLNKLGPLSGQAVAEADFLTTRDSTVRLSLTISDLRQDETVDGVLVSGVDVTALRRTEAALRQLAEIDTLTGLLNRATLMQRIHRLSLSAAPEPLAVLFCDLDGFKQVNDQLGHAAGDLVLQDVATRLQMTCWPGWEVTSSWSFCRTVTSAERNVSRRESRLQWRARSCRSATWSTSVSASAWLEQQNGARSSHCWNQRTQTCTRQSAVAEADVGRDPTRAATLPRTAGVVQW